MSKSGIIKGTLILTAAGIIVKLLGFYNRIFLTRLIGVEALGVYQLIFPIYLLAFAIACQGTQTALTKLVSHYHGLNMKQNARTALRISLLLSVLLALFISLLVFFKSDFIALSFLKHSGCGILLKILAPAIIFVTIKGCINGYFLGIQKPGFNAWSLVIEQVVRLLATILLGNALSFQFRNAILATIALTVGEGVACIVTVLFYLYSEERGEKKETVNPVKIFRLLMRDSIPLTLNRTSLTLLSSIEAVILPAMLFKFYHDKTLSIEIFGIVTGVVMPFIMFPATLTNSLSTVLLPEVSYANARGNRKAMQKAFRGSTFFCMTLGILAAVFFALFGNILGSLIFDSPESGRILCQMAFLCPLIYTATTLTSILNGMDAVVMNLVYHILSIVIRILFIIYAVPKYGTAGYIIGMGVSYGLLTLAILVHIKFYFKKNFV